MNQYVFGFFVVLASGRRNVERFCRFTPEVVGVRPYKLAGDDKNTYQRVRGGKLRGYGLEAWLRFYSPLCERGAQ